MEVPEGTPHFEMRDAHDLLEKARYDLGLFETRATSYDLFNLIYDLTHIHDWIVQDGNFNSDVKEAADNLRQFDSEVIVIRQLCNRAKHFKKKEMSPTTVHRPAALGRFKLGHSFLGQTRDLYSVVSNGEELNVFQLCQNVLKKWELALGKSAS